MNSDVPKRQPRANLEALPPVPDLIPLDRLGKEPLDTSKNAEKAKRKIECPTEEGSAGRPWRPSAEPRAPAGVINSVATAQHPATTDTLKTAGSSRRHRKLEHRMRKRGFSCDFEIGREDHEDTPTNPRVNPIFLWVRQEDTKIVDVKCEDYDKRNRILLTKTAHGWRAIPRMESLTTSIPKSKSCPSSDVAALDIDEGQHDFELRKKKKRRRHKKAKSKAIGVQVEETCFKNEDADMDELNVEKHIPAHRIHIVTSPQPSPLTPLRRRSSTNSASTANTVDMGTNTNGGSTQSVRTRFDFEPLQVKPASAVQQQQQDLLSSPLDKLLAVAELELKSVVQEKSAQSNEESPMDADVVANNNNNNIDSYTPKDVVLSTTCVKGSDEEDVNGFGQDCDVGGECLNLDEHLLAQAEDKAAELTDSYLESLVMEQNQKGNQLQLSGINYNELQGDYCDYNEDEDNTLVMDDILNRLEESLGNPEGITALGLAQKENNAQEAELETNNNDKVFAEQNLAEGVLEKELGNEGEKENHVDLDVAGAIEKEIESLVAEEQNIEIPRDDEHISEDIDAIVQKEVEALEDGMHGADIACGNQQVDHDANMKQTVLEDAAMDVEEASDKDTLKNTEQDTPLQIQPTDLSCSKRRNSSPPPLCLDTKGSGMFGRGFSQMESETIQSPEPSGIPAVTPDLVTAASPPCSEVINCEEPLDLGKPRRKSDSPSIVTCSEEVSQQRDMQKNLKNAKEGVSNSKNLQVLEKNPFEQLEYVLKHTKVRIPDPLLVPKDRLNVILTTPATEIPKLLYERPELKLPDALAFPHLLEDPDILVITIAQLQSILKKHFQTATKIEELALKETAQAKEVTPPDSVTSSAKITTTQTVNDATQKSASKVPPNPNPNQNSNHNQSQQKVQKDAPKKSTEVPTPKKNSTDSQTPSMGAQNPFNQWLWMPYLYQLEAAAMAYDNKVNDLAMKNGPQNPYNANAYPPQAYQYPNFMGPPHSPSFSYQQELMKLSNLQNLQNMQQNVEEQSAALSAAKKLKYSDVSQPLKASRGPSSKQDINMHNMANKFNFLNNNYYPQIPQMQNNAAASMEAFNSYKHKPASRSRGGRYGSNAMANRNQQLVPFGRDQNAYIQHPMVVPNPNQSSQSQNQNQSLKAQTQQLHMEMAALNNNNNNNVMGNNSMKQQQLHRNRNDLCIPSGIDPRLFGLGTQPMDLSSGNGNCVSRTHPAAGGNPHGGARGGMMGIPALGNGSNKNHYSGNILRSLMTKDDVPEVGSTTSGLEEVLQSPKKLGQHHMFHPQNCDTTHGQIGNLWHPLFGNQKNYTNPWNFPALSASQSK